MTGRLRAKYKSGLSRRWCAASAPLVSFFFLVLAAWFAHESQERVGARAASLAGCCSVLAQRSSSLEVISALVNVVNSKFVCQLKKKPIESHLTIAEYCRDFQSV